MFEMRFEDGDRILYLKYSGTVTPAVYQAHMPEVEEALARLGPASPMICVPSSRVMPAGLWNEVEASLATAWAPAPAVPMLGVPNSLR